MKNKKLNKHLNKIMNNEMQKYTWERFPDDPENVKDVKDDDVTHRQFLHKIQFNGKKEISVYRIALLKDGTYECDYGNPTEGSAWGAIHMIKDDLKRGFEG